MWAIGVVNTGNEVGLRAEELAALPPAEREKKFEQARQRLQAAGPDYLIEDVSAIDPVLEQINARLQNRERRGARHS